MDIIDYFIGNLKNFGSRFYTIKKEEKTVEEKPKQESLYLHSEMYILL